MRQDVRDQQDRPGGRDRPGVEAGRGTFPIGKIAGVHIAVNWSVLVIFGLIAYGLSAERFPDAYPGRSTFAYVVAGLLAAGVFFLSLLAHELSHALVARRGGQQVEGITLWLFGGVARLRGEARDPGTELRVAGVGPLVSLSLGGLFIGLTAILALAGAGGLVSGAVMWLGMINVALAVFNSVPAAPLDGGRLLRAFLWWRTGDAHRAAVLASQAGRGFGWLLVTAGLVLLLLRGYVQGLWLTIIGWFLITAASVEGQQAVVRQRLAGVPVWRVMTPEPVTVPAVATLREFLEVYVMRHRYSAFPVTGEDGQPVGLVTFDRIKEVPDEERARTRVGEVSLPMAEVISASSDGSVADLLPQLSSRPEGRVLVFTGERLVGIVSPRDVSRTLEQVSRSPWG